jgi:hypothetical protein
VRRRYISRPWKTRIANLIEQTPASRERDTPENPEQPLELFGARSKRPVAANARPSMSRAGATFTWFGKARINVSSCVIAASVRPSASISVPSA